MENDAHVELFYNFLGIILENRVEGNWKGGPNPKKDTILHLFLFSSNLCCFFFSSSSVQNFKPSANSSMVTWFLGNFYEYEIPVYVVIKQLGYSSQIKLKTLK